MARALDLFGVISAMDRGKGNYSSVRPGTEERKELDSLLSYPMLRWMSAGTSKDGQEFCLHAVNEIANSGYFELGKHRELQFRLLQAAGTRTGERRSWIPPLKGMGSLGPAGDLVVSHIPHARPDEIELWLEINGIEGLTALCDSMGLQKDESKTVIADYKKRIKK